MHDSSRLRTSVRLRIDKGLVLLRYGGVPSVACTLIDISEGGCRCLAPIGRLDDETQATWKRILGVGRPLSIEVSCPPHLTHFPIDVEVRLMKELEGGGVDLGMRFRNLDPEQLKLLKMAMISIASDKVRDAFSPEHAGAAKQYLVGGAVASKRDGEHPGERAVTPPPVLDEDEVPAPATATEAAADDQASDTPGPEIPATPAAPAVLPKPAPVAAQVPAPPKPAVHWPDAPSASTAARAAVEAPPRVPPSASASGSASGRPAVRVPPASGSAAAQPAIGVPPPSVSGAGRPAVGGSPAPSVSAARADVGPSSRGVPPPVSVPPPAVVRPAALPQAAKPREDSSLPPPGRPDELEEMPLPAVAPVIIDDPEEEPSSASDSQLVAAESGPQDAVDDIALPPPAAIPGHPKFDPEYLPPAPPPPPAPPADPYRGRRLGEVLVQMGKLQDGEIEGLVRSARMASERLGRFLMREGLISPAELCRALALQSGLPMTDLEDAEIPEVLIKLFAQSTMLRYEFLPFDESQQMLCIATANPIPLQILHDLERQAKRKIEVFLAQEDLVLKELDKIRPKVKRQERKHMRYEVALPIAYQFCNRLGRAAEETLYHGQTIDISEGGFLCEGNTPQLITPEDLMRRGICVRLTVSKYPIEVRALCSLRFIKNREEEDGGAQGLPFPWVFGTQVLEISEEDKRKLKEICVQVAMRPDKERGTKFV